MFVNHTQECAFDIFESRFKKQLIAQYPHIKDVVIHCYTINQYRQLLDVEPLVWNNDTFAYSVSRTSDYPNVYASIIYSPEHCNNLGLNIEEMVSAIGHEVGHIIHYFNEALDRRDSRLAEIKADEVAVELGIGQNLISVLNKLISISKEIDPQNQELSLRRNYLRLLVNVK